MVERLYKVAEVAEILGVGIDWGYRRIMAGLTPRCFDGNRC